MRTIYLESLHHVVVDNKVFVIYTVEKENTPRTITVTDEDGLTVDPCDTVYPKLQKFITLKK